MEFTVYRKTTLYMPAIEYVCTCVLFFYINKNATTVQQQQGRHIDFRIVFSNNIITIIHFPNGKETTGLSCGFNFQLLILFFILFRQKIFYNFKKGVKSKKHACKDQWVNYKWRRLYLSLANIWYIELFL